MSRFGWKLAAVPALAAAFLFLGAVTPNQGRAETKSLEGLMGELTNSFAEMQADMAFNAKIAALTAKGKYEEAIPLLKKHIEGKEAKYGAKHPKTLMALQSLGLLYKDLKRYDEAEVIFLRAFQGFTAAAGPDDSDTRYARSLLGQLYTSTGRYAEAEANLKAVLEANEKEYGKDHFQTMTSVYYLANAYAAAKQHGEAQALYERAIQGLENKPGLSVTLLQMSLDGLGGVYAAQTRYADAAAVYKRLQGAREKTLGKDNIDTLASVAALGAVELALGHYPAAEAHFKRLVATNERLHGKNHPATIDAVNKLALVYQAQGKGGDAHSLFGRVAETAESTLGDDHLETLQSLANLAAGHIAAKRYGEAETLWRRIVAAVERTRGKDSLEAADSVNSLAYVLAMQGRNSESDALVSSVKPTVERALASGSLAGVAAAGRMGTVYRAEGRYAEAEPLLKRVVEASERMIGGEHPLMGAMLGDFGQTYFEQGDWRQAAPILRRAVGILARSAQRGDQETRAGPAIRKPEDTSDWGELPRLLIKTLYRQQPAAGAADEALAWETFETAQWATNSQAAAALSQMAARAANGDPKLAAIVRERQDLSAEWRRLDQSRVAALAQSAGERDTKAEARVLNRLNAIDARLAEIGQRLAEEFTDYVSLTSPAALPAKEVQAQLGPDEALVVIADAPAVKPAPEESFIWVLTRTELRWVRSPLGGDSLQREAEALRCGLDGAAWTGRGARRCEELLGTSTSAGPGGATLPFDLARAYRLYKALFGQVEELIQGKHLILVLPGQLSRLPLHALVTADPGQGADYRNAAWLARSHALTVLPAVSSLKALRRTARPSSATKPVIGFGNPLLDGDPGQPAEKRQAQLARLRSCGKAAPLQTAALRGRRGVTRIKRSGELADVALIRRQAPLPETAGELCEVAAGLGADPAEIRLGARATEHQLKALSASGQLAQYRIVHFATHGVLPDQIEGIADPGLILTPPAEASAEDDGYLSASEVAGLKLDADWVILSACNTASAGATGAEALSGLARAFIYAQARTLLVSHWEVDSAATVKLITSAVNVLARDRSIGRAEAMRRAMLSLIGGGTPQEAHPSYWAPFVLIGEGGRG
jgi:CHAT domain-containing protein